MEAVRDELSCAQRTQYKHHITHGGAALWLQRNQSVLDSVNMK